MKKKEKTNIPRTSTGELEARSLPVWIPDHILLEAENSQFRPAELTQEHKEAIAKAQREREAWMSPKKSLEGALVRFDEELSAILINDVICPLPLHSIELRIARIMFLRPVGQYYDWDEILDDFMSDDDYERPRRKQKGHTKTDDRRMIMDARERINLKVQGKYNTGDEIIGREKHSIGRNY